mgnify:CR=1 FL=1
MGKLIELEWRKNRIGNWVRWAALLGAALGLLIFAMAFLGIANDPETGVPDAAPGHGGISSLIELLTSMCFLVFTGVMLSVFIVGAYQNGTMSLVFSYPVRRQKLLAAQMLADLLLRRPGGGEAAALRLCAGREPVSPLRLPSGL